MPSNYMSSPNDPLVKLSALEWRQRIDTIPDIKIRVRVARIIFWDMFGAKLVTEHQPELDDLVDCPLMIRYAYTPEQIANALISIGYTEKQAVKRVTPKADIEGMMRRNHTKGAQSRRGI